MTDTTAQLTKEELLNQLRMNRFSSKEEKKQRLNDLRKDPDLRIEDIFWMFTIEDVKIRKIGLWLVKHRFNTARSLKYAVEYLRKNDTLTTEILSPVVRVFSAELVVPYLGAMLDERKEKSTSLAAKAALLLPYPQNKELVLRLLDDPRKELQQHTLKMLGNQKIDLDQSVLSKLASMINDQNRGSAALLQSVAEFPFTNRLYGLAYLQNATTNQVLKRQISELIGKLLQLPDVDLNREFLPLLAAASDEMRALAVRCLTPLGSRREIIAHFVRESTHVPGWIRNRAIDELLVLGQDIYDEISGLIGDPDPEMRLAALTAMGKVDSKNIPVPVLKALKDADDRVRSVAVSICAESQDPRSPKILVKMLEDPALTGVVIEALGKRKQISAIRQILQHLKHDDPGIRLEIINALEQFDEVKTKPILERIIKADADTEVRVRAREVLEKLLRTHGEDHTYVAELERNNLRLRDTTNKSETQINRMLLEVRKMGASDFHIRTNIAPTARKYGALTPMDYPPLNADECEQLLFSVLPPELQQVLRRHKQVDTCHSIEGVGRYRTNIFLERQGYAGSFRVVPAELPTIESVGMPPHLSDMVNFHQGLIVVSGPSGSGKTTTLAALVNLINETKPYHILTLEDPIEYLHPFKKSLVNQRQIQKHTDSFARALRAALREDPDVIVVGELRDTETIGLAVTAAETGHIVIGTTHSNSAAKTVDRLIDSYAVGEQPMIRRLLSDSLKAVVNQRLLPRKDGVGRVACFEVLMQSPAISSHIRDGRTFLIPSTMQISQSFGVITLDTALERLVDADEISAEEAYFRALNKAAFAPRCSEEFRQTMENAK